MAAALDIRGLSVSWRGERGWIPALDRLDLTVEAGEIVGVVGESGCGKTTLAHAVLDALPPGLARVEAEALRVGGVDLRRDPGAWRRIRGRLATLVPQDPLASFDPLFPVGAQMLDLMRWTFPDASGGARGRRAAAEAMLEAVHLDRPREIMARRADQLSGGQRQRVMIAMALLPAPRLIVADEPTSALDAAVRIQILGLLRRIARTRGVGILFTTHDLGAAWEICDRVVVMHGGVVVETAPRAAFFAAPAHPYSRALLAARPGAGRGEAGLRPAAEAPATDADGCRFAPRCPRASAACRVERPRLRACGPDRAAACLHPWTEAPAAALRASASCRQV